MFFTASIWFKTWTWTYINSAQKMKFFIKDFFSKCDQICSFLRIWSHLLKKSLMENFIYCVVKCTTATSKNSNLYIQLISPGRSHLTPFFWLRLLFWCLMCVNKGDILLDLLNYEIIFSLPLPIPPFKIS